MNEQTWGDDERTNRAIEHLHLMGAKTDKNGRVVPRHRYTRKIEHLMTFLGTIAWAPKFQSFHLTQEHRDAATTVTAEITVETNDGTYWEQEGIVSSDEGLYSWDAMALCRALLNYVDDDGEPMTPDAVLEMLEQQRAEYIARSAPDAAGPTTDGSVVS